MKMPTLLKMKMKVLTIDGPSGVGKGTVSRIVAEQLGWDYLDSGAIYRVLAYAVKDQKIDPTDVSSLVMVAKNLPLVFNGVEVYSGVVRVTELIRSEECGQLASKVSAHLEVRAALLERQRKFATEKGLIADGRDMGTIVFPEAPLKIYLTATSEVRARRRLGQLRQAGEDVSFAALLREIEVRDERDTNRSVAPLKPAPDAIIIDTSELSIQAVCDQILSFARPIFS